jgi:hypothetical protein
MGMGEWGNFIPYAFGVVFMCGVCGANDSAELTEALIFFGIKLSGQTFLLNRGYYSSFALHLLYGFFGKNHIGFFLCLFSF